MVIYAEKNYKEVSKKASNIMAAQITLNPKSVLGLATGYTGPGNWCERSYRFYVNFQKFSA